MSVSKEVIKGEFTGNWIARFTIKKSNNTTQRIFKRGFKTRKEALEYERETILNNSQGCNIPFKNVLNQFLEYKKARVKENTFNNIKSIAKHFEYFNNMIVSEITSQTIMDYQNELLKNTNVKNSFKKIVNSKLKEVFTYCIKYKNLLISPFSKVDSLKLETSKKINILNIDEFTKIIENTKNDDFKLMFKMLFWTGARIGEVRALKINDINFIDKTISINKNINFINKSQVVGATKNKSSVRVIKIDDILIQDIKNYLEKAKYIIDDGFIFKYTKTYYNLTFKEICKKVLNREKITIHDLRHSHASFLINNGIDILLISKRLGHANPTITLNVYSHLYPNRESETMELINKIKK